MNEMSINWKRLGIVFIALASLGLLASLMIELGAENTILLNSASLAVQPVKFKHAKQNPAALYYRNDTLRFSLELPQTWTGYQVLSADTGDLAESIVSISLPVEKFDGYLIHPRDLKNGVLLAGIRVVPKATIQTKREECRAHQDLINQYREAMQAEQSITFDQNQMTLVDDCLSLYDPEAEKPASLYLGSNADSYFFRVNLEAFDNGFKTMPAGLIEQITLVYQSFKTW